MPPTIKPIATDPPAPEGRIARWARRLRTEIAFYRLVLGHARTPWLARVLLAAALAYFVSPIDVIPDFIPVLGQLDDVVIVGTLVWLAVRCLPADVLVECRARAQA
jgi:uncharacterized membrane protein YkvA (DUF1232 family)